MSQDEKLDKILSKVEKIDRGMYGDPDNGVPGLIKDNQDQEERILALEDSQKKVKYWIAGFSVTVPALIAFIKQRFGM